MTYPSCRPIRLTESVENKVELVFRDPNSRVHDAKLERNATII